MPIWSLTKERVEKLLKQVGDKELEIDELLKLTKEDLWKRDLDDFIAEWRFQLDDEAKRQKKVSNMTRRASTKLKIAGGGIAGRKRKGADSDESDFDMPKAKKTAVPKQPKPVGGLLSYMAPAPKPKAEPKAKAPTAVAKAAQRTLDLLAPTKKEPAEDDIWMSLDASGDNRPKATKARTVAPLKKPAPKKQVDSDEEEEIIRPKPGRQPRAAAAKPVKYNTLSDSDGDEMILDVATMVKGINTSSADNSRQLFSASASRPSSSSGLTKKLTSSKPAIDLDADDTNYSMLAPPATTKGPAVIARKTILPDDDDDDSLDSFDDIAPAPKASKPKPAPKPKVPAKPPTKKATAKTASKPLSLEPKQTVLSPAAKAYAAKRAKQAALEADKDSEDELDKIADEIMDDDDEEEAPAAAKRPGRRAAAAPKKWVISDDDDDDDDEGVTADFEVGDSDD